MLCRVHGLLLGERGKNFLLHPCTATFCRVQIAMLLAGSASLADILLL